MPLSPTSSCVSLHESSPNVEFCGYTIPHPSEAVMHLRIQTWGECLSRLVLSVTGEDDEWLTQAQTT